MVSNVPDIQDAVGVWGYSAQPTGALIDPSNQKPVQFKVFEPLIARGWKHFDDFSRPDGALRGTISPSGRRYLSNAFTNDPSISNHKYTVVGAVPHISAFLQVQMDEVPSEVVGEVIFDDSYGKGSRQEAVLVLCRKTYVRNVAGVTLGNPGTIITTHDHDLIDGQLVSIASIVGTTEANGTWAVTVSDYNAFMIPVELTNAWVSGGTVNTSLALQSLQLYISPGDVRFSTYDDWQLFAYDGTVSDRVKIAGGKWATPLLQDWETRYQFILWPDLPNRTVRFLLPDGTIQSVVSNYIIPPFVGSQVQWQIDSPVAQAATGIEPSPTPSGNVAFTAVAAHDLATVAPLEQRQPHFLWLTGDDVACLETEAPGWWTPGLNGISADTEFVICFDPVTIDTGVVQSIVNQWGTGAGKRRFHYSLSTAGALQSAVSIDGQNTLQTVDSASALPTGTPWFKRTRNATTGVVTDFNSTDGREVHARKVAFSAWGAAQNKTAGNPYAGAVSSHIKIGIKDTTPNNPFAGGGIRYIALRAGIGTGPYVFELDFRRLFTGMDTVGNRWTRTAPERGIRWLSSRELLTGGQSGAAAVLAINGTVTTDGVSVARVAPAGAVTGIILQAGTYPGQQVTVINESVAASSITFDVAGTSNVADGVSSVIAGLTSASFVWDSATRLWYRVA